MFFQCILTGIIIVALRGMFMQVKEFWRAWKQSKRDGIIWLVTFLSVIILDIDKALIIGLVISVLSIVLVGQKPTVITLGHIPTTSIYLDIKCYNGVSRVLLIFYLNFYYYLPSFFICSNFKIQWVNLISTQCEGSLWPHFVVGTVMER